MSAVAGDIKKLFAYKYKRRDDDLTDQYSRLFMTKAMLIAAFITGMQWYSDEIKCAVPKPLVGKHLGKYTGEACWINGFYIYDQLRHAVGCEGYYGLPTSILHNGTKRNTASCETCVAQGDKKCVTMDKKFYIQYQWYPFFLATLSLFYYLPYILFTMANSDLKNLKEDTNNVNPDIERIVKTYFDIDDEAAKNQQKGRIIFNITVKIIYILANFIAFLVCDITLNGDFMTFGWKWVDFSKIPDRNNYVSKRGFVDAAEMLLPTFGYCDVLEEWVDVKHTVDNEHKLLCEISQHVLYQYVMMALWFLMVIGIISSCLSLILKLIQYSCWEVELEKDQTISTEVHKHITIRQGEYLFFLQKRNKIVYGVILNNLLKRFTEEDKNMDDERNEAIMSANLGKDIGKGHLIGGGTDM